MPLEIKDTGLGLDLEGTLINLEREGHHAAWLQAAADAGVHISFEEALNGGIPHLIGGPDDAIIAEIFGLSDRLVSLESIGLRKRNLFEDWLRGVTVIPTRIGLFEFLEEAQRRGFNMMIATATEPELALYYIHKSGLREMFSPEKKNIVMAVPGSGIRNKPEPDIYLESARRMKIDPRNQLVFEDSVRGVTSGVASGGIVIGLPVYDLEKAIAPLIKAGAIEVYREWPEVDLNYLLSDELQAKRGNQRFL